jgi:hypothetical protein
MRPPPTLERKSGDTEMHKSIKWTRQFGINAFASWYWAFLETLIVVWPVKKLTLGFVKVGVHFSVR